MTDNLPVREIAGDPELREAIAAREHIWAVFAAIPEDQRIDLLLTACKAINPERKYLASEALWGAAL